MPDGWGCCAHALFMHTFEQHSPFPWGPVSQKLPTGHAGPQLGATHTLPMQLFDWQSELPQHAPPKPDVTHWFPMQLPEQHWPLNEQGVPTGQPVWQVASTPVSDGPVSSPVSDV